MLDKTTDHISFLMVREAGTALPAAKLPKGYYFRYYQKGDIDNWADIECSVGEFDTIEGARDYFNREFIPYERELYIRMMFLCDSQDKPIGTITAWWGSRIDEKKMPCVHWVAIKPEYQGKKLGKPLVYNGMKRMVELDGDVDFFLSTQTWSYKAVGIYKWAGFTIYKGEIKDKDNNYKKAIEVMESKME